MRERNIGEVLAELTDNNFMENINKNAEKKEKVVAQLIYFFHEGKEDLSKRIDEMEDSKEKGIIVKNIFFLYPFSQDVIKLMIKKMVVKKTEIAHYFDQLEDIVNGLKEVVSSIDESNPNACVDLYKHSKEIGGLEEKIIEKKATIDNIRKDIDKLNDKKKEFEDLEKEEKKLEEKQRSLNDGNQLEARKKALQHLKEENEKKV